MNEEILNMSIRKFLKTVGVTAQREIEQAIRAGIADGTLKGGESLPAKATITLAGTTLAIDVAGKIELA
jgi:hypothetical protein